MAPFYGVVLFVKKQKVPDVWFSNKVEPRVSEIHGVGMFATEKIMAREIIENCHIIKFDEGSLSLLEELCGQTHILNQYCFHSKGICAAVTGFAMVYNHADRPQNNARWNFETNPKTNFEYWQIVATKDIEIGEEVCISYTPYPIAFGPDGSWTRTDSKKQDAKESFFNWGLGI